MQFSYLYAVVQTEFPPDYVRSRIDSFLDDHLKAVEETVTSEEFETCRAGLLSELMMKHKTLQEEGGRYLRHFTNRTYDFERRQRCIDFVQKEASLERLQTFVKVEVRNAPRLISQVKKTHKKEDKALPEGSSIPEDKEGLRTWTTHQDTVKSFAETAVWRPINAAVAATHYASK